eukprot:3771865-Amphidinium_carterae.4
MTTPAMVYRTQLKPFRGCQLEFGARPCTSDVRGVLHSTQSDYSRPPPGLEFPTKFRLAGKRAYSGPESVMKRASSENARSQTSGEIQGVA